MKAKKKPIDSLSFEDLGIDIKPRIKQIKVEEILSQAWALDYQ